LKQLWRNEKAILEEVYGNHTSSSSINMFFLNVLMMTPNRFRP
jgi:hypothetical protein